MVKDTKCSRSTATGACTAYLRTGLESASSSSRPSTPAYVSRGTKSDLASHAYDQVSDRGWPPYRCRGSAARDPNCMAQCPAVSIRYATDSAHRKQTEVMSGAAASARSADITAAGPIATQRGWPRPSGSPCSCSSSVTSDATAPAARDMNRIELVAWEISSCQPRHRRHPLCAAVMSRAMLRLPSPTTGFISEHRQQTSRDVSSQLAG